MQEKRCLMGNTIAAGTTYLANKILKKGLAFGSGFERMLPTLAKTQGREV